LHFFDVRKLTEKPPKNVGEIDYEEEFLLASSAINKWCITLIEIIAVPAVV
jgi:hypothetical protein